MVLSIQKHLSLKIEKSDRGFMIYYEINDYDGLFWEYG